MVLPNWASMKGTGMDGASATVSGKEFRKGGVEVVGNKRGNDVFFSIQDNEKVTGACGIEVVLPPRTWEDSRYDKVGGEIMPL